MPERMPHERRIVGNYQLLRVLGKGGFAEVYLGKHIHLNTYAAVKLLRTHMDRQAVDKFRREARLVAQLRHPHIISITDFGVTAGVPYLVMDYAPGGTLRQLFPEGTVVDPLTVLSYLSPIAEALDYAHSEHIVHRDVKPENMLIGSADTILLGDFGIAAVIADTLNPTPQTVAGTTAYMAPEQLRGRSQYASDQYALAIVAYEWLCGERPFRGSFAEVAAQHLHADPPSLRKRNPNIPAALEEVIMIALSKQPAQRFPSVGDFVTDFERVLRRPGGRTAPVRTIGVRPT
ncbi:MAG TPA: serine/threonine-protein kinase, partial [Ktedonobacteraceae bacterium]|nr:serine/threonine-protein kinase [Ktedonobacteraceae bacterium]